MHDRADQLKGFAGLTLAEWPELRGVLTPVSLAPGYSVFEAGIPCSSYARAGSGRDLHLERRGAAGR